MIYRRHVLAAAAVVSLATAGGAVAEVANGGKLAITPYKIDAAPAPIDGWIAKTPRAQNFTEANALRAAGIARTSFDRRFADADATGSLGFLCGIQPGHDTGGVAAAHGSDPQGRFLGAKLSRSF